MPAEEDAGSEASEWELRERREREEERRAEDEELGVEGEEQPLFSPRPCSWYPRKRTRGRVPISYVLSYLCFPCDSSGAHLIFLVRAWAEGKGELATCRQRTGNGLCTVLVTIYLRRMRVMNKQKREAVVAASRLHIRKSQSHPDKVCMAYNDGASGGTSIHTSPSLSLAPVRSTLRGPTDVTLPIRVVPSKRKRHYSIDSSCSLPVCRPRDLIASITRPSCAPSSSPPRCTALLRRCIHGKDVKTAIPRYIPTPIARRPNRYSTAPALLSSHPARY